MIGNAPCGCAMRRANIGPTMPPTKRTPTKTGSKTPPRKPNYLAEATRLEAILRDRNMSKAELARRIKRPYLDVARWCAGHFFTPANQALVCRKGLGLPAKALQSPGAAASARAARKQQPLSKQEADAQALAALAAFEQTPNGKALSPETWHVLRSIEWNDPTLRPTPLLIEALALKLEGAISAAEVADYIATNTELDRTLSENTTPKKR